MDTRPYHVSVYLYPSSNCDSGVYHAEHNVRLSADELIEFNRRWQALRDKMKQDHDARLKAHWARERQMQKEGKSTRDLMHRTPCLPEFSVTVFALEESMIDGTKLLERFEEFKTSEAL